MSFSPSKRKENDAEFPLHKRCRIDGLGHRILEQHSWQPPNNDSLCDRCAAIDFSSACLRAIARRNVNQRKLYTIAKLSAQLFQSRCNLCQFFAACQVAWGLPDGKYSVYVHAKHNLLGTNSDDNIAFRLQCGRRNQGPSSGWILPCLPRDSEASNIAHARISRSSLDLEVVKQWLSFCGEHHTSSCADVVDMSIPGFRVIDCATRKIVTAPRGCTFAALSYLWGSSSSESSRATADAIPLPAPLLIEDALTVTRILGIPFLWIDRYCVPQDDAEKKHVQIQNMNKIYNGAFLTIVDATGDCPDLGLSGISASRTPLQSVDVGGHRLVCIPDIKHDVDRSPWSKRGWTYQEGLLSRRRLIFTHKQMYFQCLNMHCCEAVALSLRTCHTKDLTRLREGTDAFRVFPPRGIGKQGHDISSRVNEYAGRTLSFDSDALNAFLGVFQAYAALQSPVYHFWGIPMGQVTEKHHNSDVLRSFLYSLLWRPRTDAKSCSAVRRRQFPSWSWVAWKPVQGYGPWRPLQLQSWEFHVDYFHHMKEEHPFHASVGFRKHTGQIVDVHEYVGGVLSGVSFMHYEPALYLTGWVMKIRLAQAPGEQYAGQASGELGAVQVTHPVPTNLASSVIDSTDVETMRKELFSNSWIAVTLECPGLEFRKDIPSKTYGSRVTALVCQHKGFNAYARVGVVAWDMISFCQIERSQGYHQDGGASEVHSGEIYRCTIQSRFWKEWDRGKYGMTQHKEDEGFVMEFQKRTLRII